MLVAFRRTGNAMTTIATVRTEEFSRTSSVPQTCQPILELRGVSKRFQARPDIAHRLAIKLKVATPPPAVHAVSGVNLAIRSGEVVGLVGESGCGKSTLGRLAVGLHKPTEGLRLLNGQSADGMDAQTLRKAQLQLQMVFQDPYASLNPRLRVEMIVGEAPVVRGFIGASQRREHVAELLRTVGLDPSAASRFPHQFSGGQRARVGIARALALQPRFLVCDEAVAALDVSIQAQIINLFMSLRERLALTYLFISHDLSVVRHICDRVVIMYLGRVVEEAPVDELFSRPNHPYAQALLAETPTLEVRKRSFVAIKGEIPSPLNPPSGCHFHPRCPHAIPRCASDVPQLRAIAPGHRSACHLNDAH
jgi:peptide/nickel transport system ATP-binding protein